MGNTLKDKDKQIEEMVKAVCIQMRDYPKLTCKKCKADNRSTNAYCRIQFEMEQLYNAGYRKSSDVVRDIFNDLNEMWHKGRGFINYPDLVRLERLHEQKYTEEGK